MVLLHVIGKSKAMAIYHLPRSSAPPNHRKWPNGFPNCHRHVISPPSGERYLVTRALEQWPIQDF